MSSSEHDDVTVVVTCFNYGEYLGEAVSSALAQEGGPPRVIVVNDGSTETTTVQALEALPDGVQVIRRENGGLAAARNTGLAATSTAYLIVLDADDRLRLGALRALRAPLDATSESDDRLGFTYGRTHFFGDWEGEVAMPPYDPYKLLYRHTIGSTALMRREVWEQTGGFDPAFRAFEDWEFWLHALHHGWRGMQVADVTFDYRRHGQTMLAGGRLRYRHWYGMIRDKHAPLYARARKFAAESDLGPLGRAVYRWFWGPRPVPARVEAAIYGRLFRAGSTRRSRR